MSWYLFQYQFHFIWIYCCWCATGMPPKGELAQVICFLCVFFSAYKNDIKWRWADILLVWWTLPFSTWDAIRIAQVNQFNLQMSDEFFHGLLFPSVFRWENFAAFFSTAWIELWEIKANKQLAIVPSWIMIDSWKFQSMLKFEPKVPLGPLPLTKRFEIGENEGKLARN